MLHLETKNKQKNENKPLSGDKIHVEDVPQFYTRDTIFFTSCLLFFTPKKVRDPSEKAFAPF